MKLTKKLLLTEAEHQFLASVMLDMIKMLEKQLGKNKAEEYLISIDKNHCYTIYKKLTN